MVYTFTPQQTTLIQKAIGRTRRILGVADRPASAQLLLDEIQLQLRPGESAEMRLDRPQRKYLSDALGTFAGLRDPKFGQPTVSEEDQRQAYEVIEILLSRPGKVDRKSTEKQPREPRRTEVAKK